MSTVLCLDSGVNMRGWDKGSSAQRYEPHWAHGFGLPLD